MGKKYYSEIRVIYADTDGMRIVYHSNYIKWFEVARAEYLREIGFTYADLENNGVWLPVVEVSCRYKKPAIYDDILHITTWLEELNGASFKMKYEIRHKITNEILVTGASEHAITDPELKPVRLKKICPALFDAMEKTK